MVRAVKKQWKESTTTVEGEEFWIVLRHIGASSQHFRNQVTMFHPTEKLARAEAARLAIEQNDRFYVMKTTAFVEPLEAPLRWSDQPL